jgi:hypothetical protein
MSAQHIHFFFNVREQLKLYHWQTGLYARHIGTDVALEDFDKSIDLFVEIYMGKYGRPNITRTTNTIQIKNMSEKSAVKFVASVIAHLQGPLTRSIKATDTDLFNIRDEMLGQLNKLLYLFTLR